MTVHSSRMTPHAGLVSVQRETNCATDLSNQRAGASLPLEIAALVIFKIIVLTTLYMLFFRHPLAPDMVMDTTQVERQILAAPTNEKGPLPNPSRSFTGKKDDQ